MNPHIAEQLLYDSEATLRLVDTLLDELQVMEPPRHGDDLTELPDLLLSAATQAHAVLEGLAQSREVLDRTSFAKFEGGSDELLEMPGAIEVREGLERALLLVDRLDQVNDPAVRSLLRAEIIEMLVGVRTQEITEQQLSYASSVLRDTESRLSALAHLLSPRPAPVIRFPGGWAES